MSTFPHPANKYICKKSTMERLEESLKHVQINNKDDTRTTSMTLLWCLYCQL